MSLGQTDAVSVSPSVCVRACVRVCVLKEHRFLNHDLAEEEWNI